MERDLNIYSQQYAEQPFEPVMVKFRQQKTLALTGDLSGKKILEIGCGLEPGFTWIQNFSEFHIIEPSPLFYQHAQKCANAHASAESIHLYNYLAEDCKFDDNIHFDYILINSLLHELENPLVLLKHIHSICAPHTRVIVNVPNAHSLHRMLAVYMGLIPNPAILSESNFQFHQHHVFSVDTLTQLVQKAGFTILHTETAFIKPFTHLQMQDMLDKGLLSQALLNGLMEVSKDLPENGADIYMILEAQK
jgi:SAM-dependent methyltransferase